MPPPPTTAAGKRKVVQAPSKWQDPRGPAVEPPEKVSTDPELEAYYAEHNPEALRGHGGQLLLEGPEDDEGPRQYRANTTGLSTDHLPRPPGRRDGADGRSPPLNEPDVPRRPPALPPAKSLGGPPKLPSRMGARSPPKPTTETTNNGGLNQGAMNRLGAAGVSVSALGIGNKSTSPAPPPPTPPRRQDSGTPPMPLRQQPTQPAHINSLQNRFAKMTTQNADTMDAPAAPAQGTTWQQKQAALKTASQFQKDPSSISFSDARAAASTANNFRQRHGEQAAAGWNKANQVNERYGVANKLGGLAGGGSNGQGMDAGGGSGGAAAAVLAAAGKKKPPPPPTKKKPAGFGAAASPVQDDDAPPPIPMSTRPQF